MFDKIKDTLSNPVTYVVLAVGAVLAFAFGRFLKPLKQVADQLPGSDAKTGA